jgi:hypothetical protein
MIITKKCLPRRTFLRGLGVGLGLPLLDAMAPALVASSKTAASPVRRLGVVYLPNGMAMEYWTPAAEGAAFELTPVLQPLQPFRDRLLVLSGLSGPRAGIDHAGGSTMFLTGKVPPRPNEGKGIELGTSIDQIVAKQFGQETQLASLEVKLDGADVAGSCDGAFSCAYTNTISWRTPTTPLPMENDPRAVFERLFGDSGSTDSAARLALFQRERSILDSLTERVSSLERRVGPSDRARITEYLESVRDIERRIQKAEEQNTRELPLMEQPVGIPGSFEEHAKLMFDLQVLAYQCDLTRVITFMMGRELSGRAYPEIGVPEAHHPLSHHDYIPERIATLSKINTFHVTLFAYYLEKLRSTPDGDGSLLDHVMIMYGAGISDSNAHKHDNLPILLVGGGAGRLQSGRHLKYSGDSKDAECSMANLLMTVVDKMGVPVEQIGNSTGKLPIETLSGV